MKPKRNRIGTKFIESDVRTGRIETHFPSTQRAHRENAERKR